jgi:hypothetical protein
MSRLAGGRALAAAVAAVAFAGLGLAGCTSGESTAPVSAPLPTKPSFSKGDVGALRTDTEPISKRWPKLGTIISAQWYGGILGDPRVPGPSTYWVDAVVELEPAVMEALRAKAGTLKAESPDIVDELVPKLPPGPFSRSGALDLAVQGTFMTRVWLPAAGNRLIIAGMGQ